MEKNDKIVCTNIWKVFGPNEKNVLTNLDKNLSRSEVQEKTGHVVAVKDVSFSVQKGLICSSNLFVNSSPVHSGIPGIS